VSRSVTIFFFFDKRSVTSWFGMILFFCRK